VSAERARVAGWSVDFGPEPVTPAAALAKNVTVVDLVEAFEEAERGARAGFRAIDAAEQRLRERFGVTIGTPEHGWNDARGVERVVDEMTRKAWSVLVDRLELRQILSIAEYDKIQRDLQHEKWPPITEENVTQFKSQFREKAPEMLKAAVLEVFQWLRPHEHDHVHRLKTNTELEIGPKVILSNVIDRSWFELSSQRHTFHVNYHRTQNLLALERVFLSLDGRGVAAKTWQSEIQTAIERVSPVGETSLFKYKAHRNGNLHISFKRLDLLAKLNAVAGGKTLRPDSASGWTKSDRSTRAYRPAPDMRPAEQRGEKELAFFETPAELADRIVALAGLRYDDRVLEPSAGTGALACALRRVLRDDKLTCIEIHPDRARALRTAGFQVVEADFLSFEPTLFDAVIANPPWHARSDVRHAAAMLRWLKPGGSLVVVLSASAMTRADAEAVEFRRDVAERSGRFEKLEPGSFVESGTMVNACLCIVPRRGREGAP
jgi:predicted RNA methylase